MRAASKEPNGQMEIMKFSLEMLSKVNFYLMLIVAWCKLQSKKEERKQKWRRRQREGEKELSNQANTNENTY